MPASVAGMYPLPHIIHVRVQTYTHTHTPSHTLTPSHTTDHATRGNADSNVCVRAHPHTLAPTSIVLYLAPWE